MSDRTFERIQTLFDIKQFEPVRVFIVGCGSGGGSVALQLVMSGIRKFSLLDRDVLGPENVIRHVCGRQFVGQKKVDALEAVLKDRNPEIEVKKIQADVMTFDGLEEEIKRSSVVILATDNEPSRYRVNELCVKNSVPFVVGRVFTRGIGGEVFAFRSDFACLACLEGYLQRTKFREGIREIDLVSAEEREKIYGMEVAEIKDSPGLAVDIAFITAFHTRFALDAIIRGLKEAPKALGLIEDNYFVWGNRPVHPFDKHFWQQRIKFNRQENCAVCSREAVKNV